jgi:hypothetical protein
MPIILLLEDQERWLAAQHFDPAETVRIFTTSRRGERWVFAGARFS